MWTSGIVYPDSLRIRALSCQTARSGTYRLDDTARLPGHRIAAGPDRAGSGRVGRASPGPAGKCAGVVGRWNELRGGRQGLLLDDDTIRTWHQLYEEEGIEGLASFGYEGSACRLSAVQQDRLKAWITETLPRTTREVGAWIETECGIADQGRSGLIALLHRLEMEHRKPKAVSRKLDLTSRPPSSRHTRIC